MSNGKVGTANGAHAPQSAWMGFWHGFGACGLDSSVQILRRKQEEARSAGWTLWLARRAPRKTFAAWHNQLATGSPDAVQVLCAAVRPPEPASENRLAWRRYRFAGESGYRPIPEPVRLFVPHAWPHAEALAFVVQEVIYPAPPLALPGVEWFSTRGAAWRRTPLPEKCDNLLRVGAGAPIRACSALLVLRKPYLAIVGAAS